MLLSTTPGGRAPGARAAAAQRGRTTQVRGEVPCQGGTLSQNGAQGATPGRRRGGAGGRAQRAARGARGGRKGRGHEDGETGSGRGHPPQPPPSHLQVVSATKAAAAHGSAAGQTYGWPGEKKNTLTRAGVKRRPGGRILGRPSRFPRGQWHPRPAAFTAAVRTYDQPNPTRPLYRDRRDEAYACQRARRSNTSCPVCPAKNGGDAGARAGEAGGAGAAASRGGKMRGGISLTRGKGAKAGLKRHNGGGSQRWREGADRALRLTAGANAAPHSHEGRQRLR